MLICEHHQLITQYQFDIIKQKSKKHKFTFARHEISHLSQCLWNILFNVNGKAPMLWNAQTSPPCYEMYKLACDWTLLFELCHPALNQWVGVRCVCFALEGDPNISLGLVHPSRTRPKTGPVRLLRFSGPPIVVPWNRATLDLAMFKEFWWWYLETRPKTIRGTGPVWIRFCVLQWPSFWTSGKWYLKNRTENQPQNRLSTLNRPTQVQSSDFFFWWRIAAILAKCNGKGKCCHKFSDFCSKTPKNE